MNLNGTNKNWLKQHGSQTKKLKIKAAESTVDDMVKTLKAMAFANSLLSIDWDYHREQYTEYQQAKYNERFDDDIIKEYQHFCLGVIDRADKARKSIDSKIWKKEAMNIYHQM
jgi:hypothetical protein